MFIDFVDVENSAKQYGVPNKFLHQQNQWTFDLGQSFWDIGSTSFWTYNILLGVAAEQQQPFYANFMHLLPRVGLQLEVQFQETWGPKNSLMDLFFDSSRSNLRATSHMSQGMWLCDCEGPRLSSKGCTNCSIYVVCQNLRPAYLLRVGLTRIPAHHDILCVVCHCRNPCRLFIHDNFFGSLGLHFLVWSELGQSWPFQPMRDVGMQWSWPCSPMCEVPLQVDVPKSNIAIIGHLHLYVVRCGYKSGHQKTQFVFKKIRLCAHNMVTIPSSLVNMIGGGDYMTTY